MEREPEISANLLGIEMTDFTSVPPPPKPPAPLTADDLAALNDEIAAMARAGLPLDQGLKSLADEMGRGRLQAVTAQLSHDLQLGKTLPEALAAQGNNLPPFYASLVAAGIRSGRLGDALATLTTYARTISELRATIVNSLLYPAIILLLSFGLLLGWLLFIGPQFRKTYADFKLRLPWATEWILYLADHPWAVCAVPVGFLLIAIGYATWLSRNESGRLRAAKIVYALPLVGTLVHSARLAAFVDLLSILVDHKVPLPEAFRIASTASSDPLLRVGAVRICDKLDRGQPLAASLHGEKLVPEFLAWMAGMGERNQRLAETLRHTAEFYRKQAETRASLFRSVFPATALIFVAIVVVTFVSIVALFPMLGLIEGLTGGIR